MVDLKSYFHDRYKGGQDFVENVIKPIFGEDRYEDAYEEDVLEDNPELLKMADATGISQIIRMGTIDIPMNPTDVYDIMVGSRVQMERNRVKIQSLVRGIMSTYSSAFMVFHYEDDTRWDWRFTFCSKFGSNKEATDSKRYTFLLGPNQSCRTAADNFSKLAQKHGDIELDDIVDAFDVEALSKEFFAKYKAHYEKFCQFVYDNKDNCDYFGQEFSLWEDKIIRDYVKKLLGRIVFLHFLQKKGWLGVPAGKPWGDGDTQFMKHLFEASSEVQKDSYLDMVLEPLFADALNTQRENDVFNLHVEGFTDTKIPYLNGGLFERDELDAPKSVFPAAYFESLFEFLSQYNFTIDENDPNDAEMGIDPEMLGRIFENLLEDNKDKGAFYTPKEIVQYMCRESLIAYLTTCVMKKQGEDHQPEDKIRDAVRELLKTPETIVPKMSEEHLEDFGTYIRMVKICDPAIGSGAFPMGLLNELVRCRASIGAWATDAQGTVLTGDYAALKAEIICNNIYGVDIEKGAVDIARLRFWLSIIVDEQSPHALPNFDYKFMQGNSLIPTFDGQYVNLDTDGQQHVNVDKMKKEKRRLYNLKREHYGATGLRKYQLSVEIKDCILQLISLQLGYELRHWFQQNVVQTSLFPDDEPKQLSFADIMPALPPERQRICDLGAALRAKLNDATIPIEERAQTDIRFFDWRMMFTEVFEGENPGFDIVIGNPPYVEAKKLKYIASTLKPLFDVYSGTADLSIYFVEQGKKLLAANGVLSYITTNKFFNTGYGKPLRKLIISNKINKLIDFEQVEVFEGILVSSVILEMIKTETSNSDFTYEKFYKLDAFHFKEQFVSRLGSFGTYPSSELDENEWSFSDVLSLKIKKHIENGHKLLGDTEGINIYRGVTTGYNPAFIIDNAKRDELIAQDPKNATIIKNMLQGRNIRKWYYNESDENMIFTRKGTNIDEYPIVKNYLYAFYNNLKAKDPNNSDPNQEGRKPGNYKWFEILDNTAYYREFEKPEKIIWGLTADKWAYTLDKDRHYLPSNGYILTSTEIPTKYILGLLNSKLLHYYFKFIGVMTAGGAYTLKAATISALPFANTNNYTPIINLVDRILAAKKANPQADTSEWEKEIDILVYHLYNLTYDEVLVVDPENIISREEYDSFNNMIN